jgi:uncharacterized protein (DUF362 family)
VLRRGAGAVVGTGLACAGGYWLYDPTGDAGLPKPGDNVIRLKNYFAHVDWPASNPCLGVATGSAERIEQIVRAAVGSLDPARGLKRFITGGDVVLIKPNVGFDRSPRLGATTNPEVLRWVIRLCREAGAARIIVADNPIEAPQACFAKTQIRRVTEAEGGRVMLPSQARFAAVTIRDRAPDPARFEALDRWQVFYRPLADATKVIGLAPIKDHNLCGGSMNMKNWYGLLGGRRNQFHQAIHNIVSDLAMMMSPTLVIADGTRVMMRNGPSGGRISDVKPGGEIGRPTIVASVDQVACDAWCYRHMLGRNPDKLAYLKLAAGKISEQIASGQKRLSASTWQDYERQGKLVTTDVG